MQEKGFLATDIWLLSSEYWPSQDARLSRVLQTFAVKGVVQ